MLAILGARAVAAVHIKEGPIMIDAKPALSAISTLVLILMLAACQSISRLTWDLPDGVKTVAVNG